MSDKRRHTHHDHEDEDTLVPEEMASSHEDATDAIIEFDCSPEEMARRVFSIPPDKAKRIARKLIDDGLA